MFGHLVISRTVRRVLVLGCGILALAAVILVMMFLFKKERVVIAPQAYKPYDIDETPVKKSKMLDQLTDTL